MKVFLLKDGKCEAGQSCLKRHPNICKYHLNDIQGCKHGEFCKYLHKQRLENKAEPSDENNDANTNRDIKNLMYFLVFSGA